MKRQIAAGSLVLVSAVALAGCFGSDEPTPATPATTQAAPATTAPAPATTAAAPATTQASSGTTLTPPSGASQLQQAQRNGAEYSRFSISGTAPADVVADYKTQLTAAGFSITSDGGGGGGWGQYGGSDAGLSANNGSEWVSVQAGGQSGSTTYFEVCVGPSSTSVSDCDDASNDGDQNQDDQGQQDNQDQQQDG